METIKVSHIDNSNVSRRFLELTHTPPLKSGQFVCVTDGVTQVEGKITQSDWTGKFILDTAPANKGR